eukprot:6307832-Amphidinium_carterae.1
MSQRLCLLDMTAAFPADICVQLKTQKQRVEMRTLQALQQRTYLAFIQKPRFLSIVAERNFSHVDATYGAIHTLVQRNGKQSQHRANKAGRAV